mgnify:FL=1
MKIKKNKLLIYLSLGVLLLLFTHCTTFISDNNMRWTAQYDFIDLYKKRNNGFNPGSDKQIGWIISPAKNIIIIGAQKDTPEFESTATEKQAVLYISTDRGQSYSELILNGEDVYDIFSPPYTKEYSIIRTKGDKYKWVYLLNHKTFKIKEIDKHKYNDKTYYDDFDGRFLKCEKNEVSFQVDVLSKDTIKLYEVPKEFAEYQYYPVHQNGDILYYNNLLELRTYNVVTGEDKLFKQLKHKYDYFLTEDYSSYNTPLSLQKVENENDEEKKIITIYDLEENFVRKITKENREKYYFYKDFICDYTNLHSRGNTLRFSFDKGKTWKTHHIPMDGLLVFNKNVGFFEDKYIIFEGIFFRGASTESGNRIMVGEFIK